MPAWTGITHEKVRGGETAFHAGLPHEETAFDGEIVTDPGRIHDTARIQYDDCFRKSVQHLFGHGLFRRTQIKVAVAGRSAPVGAFCGITAVGEDGCIRKLPRRGQKLIRKLGLRNLPGGGFFAGLPKRSVRALDSLLVKLRKPSEKEDLALGLFLPESVQ